MLKIVGQLCEGVTVLARFVLGTAIAAIVLITLAAVWWRYVINDPISWIEQVSNILFIWVVFIGAAILYRQNLHIGVDFLLAMMPEKLRAIWEWVIDLGNLTFIIVLFVCSLKLSIDVLPNTYGALDLSPAWFYFSAPVSCAMMMLFFIEKLLDPSKRVPHGEAGEF